MNPKIAEVTQRIIERSKETRKAYLEKIEEARRQGPHRGVLSCGCAQQRAQTLVRRTSGSWLSRMPLVHGFGLGGFPV